MWRTSASNEAIAPLAAVGAVQRACGEENAGSGEGTCSYRMPCMPARGILPAAGLGKCGCKCQRCELLAQPP